MTRSTEPMSMPNSSELVLINAGSHRPQCPSSKCRRSRDSEPWYGRVSSVPASWFTRAAIFRLGRPVDVQRGARFRRWWMPPPPPTSLHMREIRHR